MSAQSLRTMWKKPGRGVILAAAVLGLLALPGLALAQQRTTELRAARPVRVANVANVTRDVEPSRQDTVASPEAAARQWMVSLRANEENLSRSEASALEAAYAQLSPAEARVMLIVYELAYETAYPYVRPTGPADPADNAREWLLAYRIVNNRLTVREARAYAGELAQMSAEQLDSLATSLHEQLPPPRQANRQDEPDRRRRDEIEDRIAFEQTQRQLALERASTVRNQTVQAQSSVGEASAVAGQQASGQVLREQDLARRSYDVRVGQNSYMFWDRRWLY